MAASLLCSWVTSCATASAPSAIDLALDELADEFEILGDWEERYRHVIDLGRGLPPLTEAEHALKLRFRIRQECAKVRRWCGRVWRAHRFNRRI